MAQRGSTKGRTMIEEINPTKRDGKTVAVDQPIPPPQRPRAFTWARIVALVVIGVMLFGLTYIGFAPGDAAVSVPQGAHAGQLTMHPCTYAAEKGAMPRRLRNARRAREPGRPPVAPDRAAGNPDPGSLIAPVGANLPSQRRPGRDQHDVPPSEPPGRPARCRHGRLPRRRRLFGAELSRGDGGARELRTTSPKRR